MELVKGVQLPEGEEGIRGLLVEGVDEVVIGEPHEVGEGVGGEGVGRRDGEISGRELLKWGTRTVGDYYAHGVLKKEAGS